MLSKIKGEVELLERHLSVMRVVARNGPIGIMKLTEETGQPQHRVRYSLRVLEPMQYTKSSPAGAFAPLTACTLLAPFNEALAALCQHLAVLHQDKIISKS